MPVVIIGLVSNRGGDQRESWVDPGIGSHDPAPLSEPHPSALARHVGAGCSDRSEVPPSLPPVLTAVAQRRIAWAAHAAVSSAEKLANYFVGQIVGTMNQRRAAGQVVMEIVEEYIESVESLARQHEV